MIRLLTLIIAVFPSISSAALFGPDSYEDCMNDGKVGRAIAEMQMLKLKCQKEFPKLKKLSKAKNVNLSCFSTDNHPLYLSIKGKKVTNKVLNFEVYGRDDNNVYISGLDNEDNDIEHSIKVNFSDGSIYIDELVSI